VAAVGLGILLASAWLSLIVVTRIDELFFPGQGISIGGLAALPGVQDDGQTPKERINVLVLGLDRRPREGDAPARTDTMFVVTVDPKTKTAGILGIPRDLWVEIPTRDGGAFYNERINTAYITGETQRYSGGGPALAKRVIERAIGKKMHHYVIIDFEGFVRMIDELGGIDVDVQEEIYDPYYSRTELPGDYYPLHFAIGLQHMDGETALDYSRTRFGSSDLDRIRRQQQVIFAAIDRALQQRLINIDSLVGLWRRYKDAIDTDVNDLQAPGFASLAAQIDPANIAALSIGAATRGWVTPQGASVLLADKAMVEQIVEALFSDQAAPEAALVEVQNAAGAEGLAAEVVQYLTAAGFASGLLFAANAPDGTVRPQTEIIDFTGRPQTAEQLASLLGVPAGLVRQAGPGDSALLTTTADVLVILGADAQTRDFGAGASGG
jgi:LCP family protein required for cell wall assembly